MADEGQPPLAGSKVLDVSKEHARLQNTHSFLHTNPSYDGFRLMNMMTKPLLVDMAFLVNESEYFEVQKSRIPNAGFGVVAKQDITGQGWYVINYAGDVMTTIDENDDYTISFYEPTLQTAGPFTIRGNESNLGNVIQHSAQKPNCQSVQFRENDLNDGFCSWMDPINGVILIRILRQIKKGEELFMNYGPKFGLTKSPPLLDVADWNQTDMGDDKWTSSVTVQQEEYSVPDIFEFQPSMEASVLPALVPFILEGEEEQIPMPEETGVERYTPIFFTPATDNALADKWMEWATESPDLFLVLMMLLTYTNYTIPLDTNQLSTETLPNIVRSFENIKLADDLVVEADKIPPQVVKLSALLREVFLAPSLDSNLTYMFARQRESIMHIVGMVRWLRRFFANQIKEGIETLLREEFYRDIQKELTAPPLYSSETAILYPFVDDYPLKEFQTLSIISKVYSNFLSNYPAQLFSVLPSLMVTLITRKPNDRLTLMDKIVPSSNDFTLAQLDSTNITKAMMALVFTGIDLILGMDLVPIQLDAQSIKWIPNNKTVEQFIICWVDENRTFHTVDIGYLPSIVTINSNIIKHTRVFGNEVTNSIRQFLHSVADLYYGYTGHDAFYDGIVALANELDASDEVAMMAYLVNTFLSFGITHHSLAMAPTTDVSWQIFLSKNTKPGSYHLLHLHNSRPIEYLDACVYGNDDLTGLAFYRKRSHDNAYLLQKPVEERNVNLLRQLHLSFKLIERNGQHFDVFGEPTECKVWKSINSPFGEQSLTISSASKLSSVNTVRLFMQKEAFELWLSSSAKLVLPYELYYPQTSSFLLFETSIINDITVEDWTKNSGKYNFLQNIYNATRALTKPYKQIEPPTSYGTLSTIQSSDTNQLAMFVGYQKHIDDQPPLAVVEIGYLVTRRKTVVSHIVVSSIRADPDVSSADIADFIELFLVDLLYGVCSKAPIDNSTIVAFALTSIGYFEQVTVMEAVYIILARWNIDLVLKNQVPLEPNQRRPNPSVGTTIHFTTIYDLRTSYISAIQTQTFRSDFRKSQIASYNGQFDADELLAKDFVAAELKDASYPSLPWDLGTVDVSDETLNSLSKFILYWKGNDAAFLNKQGKLLRASRDRDDDEIRSVDYITQWILLRFYRVVPRDISDEAVLAYANGLSTDPIFISKFIDCYSYLIELTNPTNHFAQQKVFYLLLTDPELGKTVLALLKNLLRL